MAIVDHTDYKTLENNELYQDWTAKDAIHWLDKKYPRSKTPWIKREPKSADEMLQAMRERSELASDIGKMFREIPAAREKIVNTFVLDPNRRYGQMTFEQARKAIPVYLDAESRLAERAEKLMSSKDANELICNVSEYE